MNEYVTERLEKLNERLKLVEVRDPLKTLLQPKLEFAATPEGVISLRVFLHSVDAVTGGPFVVPSSYELAPHQVSRYSRNENLGPFVHHCLLEALRHETDESVFYGGVHAIKPIHWGPGSLDAVPRLSRP